MSKASVLTCLILLTALGSASGQTERPKPLPSEALEKYDDPPASTFGGPGVSPGMISQHDTFTSYQVNVNANGQNITGDAANEPSDLRRPDQPQQDGHRLEAVQQRGFQLPAVRRRATPAMAARPGRFPVFSKATSSAATRSCTPMTPAVFSISAFCRHFSTTMWRSLNGGQTWTNIAPATGGDKQWFVIDNTDQHRSRIPVPVLEHRRQQLSAADNSAVPPTADSPG